MLTDELMTDGPGNTTFAVNTLRWLLGDDDRMALVGRARPIRKLTLGPDDLTRVGWVVMAGMPLLVFLCGLLVVFMRRGR